jgi:ribose transport system ATP-binding protein
LGIEKSRGLFLDNKSAKEIAKELFDQLLPGLDINKRVYQLTPVEMQVVEIAKAVAEEPRVLILDEPTASLEKEQVQSLFTYMRKLAKKGIGMIFTSHRMWEVLEICDDVIVFKNGETAGSIDFRKDKKDLGKIITMITGESREVSAVKKHREIPDDYIFTVEGLKYGNLLKGIDIKLKKGEILGIGGLTGQGQHELMLALAGNYKKAACKTQIGGREIKLNKPVNAIRNGIMLVPGDRQAEGLFLKHSIFLNMVFPKLSLKKQPVVTPVKRYKAECKEIVKTLSVVAKDLQSPVDTLSGGNQQKVVVGKWLSFDMKVLLLSDPAKGVDVSAKRDLYAFISRLVKEKNMGVILYASDSEELLENCDRVLIMYEGQIACELAGDRLNSDEIVTASMSLK